MWNSVSTLSLITKPFSDLDLPSRDARLFEATFCSSLLASTRGHPNLLSNLLPSILFILLNLLLQKRILCSVMSLSRHNLLLGKDFRGFFAPPPKSPLTGGCSATREVLGHIADISLLWLRKIYPHDIPSAFCAQIQRI